MTKNINLTQIDLSKPKFHTLKELEDIIESHGNYDTPHVINAKIQSISYYIDREHGAIPSPRIPIYVSSWQQSVSFGANANSIANAGLQMQTLVRLLDLEDNVPTQTVELALVKNVPCRVVTTSGRVIALGNFLTDEFITSKEFRSMGNVQLVGESL